MATRTVQPVVANAGGDSSRNLVAALVAIVNQLSAQVNAGTRVLGNPTLVIDTNFDIKNSTAFDLLVGGAFVPVSANVSFNTGTTQVTTADQWVAAVLSLDDDGTTAYVDFAAEAASEALAKAAMADVTPTGDNVIGYATILTGSAVTWTAGTDALQGGTGGTPSADTNYYNDPTLAGYAAGVTDVLAYATGTTPT